MFKEANAEATRALTKGAESIGFCIASKEFSAADLDTLLKGISLKTTELTFCGCGVKTVAELFADKLENSDLNPEEVKVNFVIDPIINKLTLKGKLGCKEGAPKAFSTIADLIKKVPQYKRVRFVGVNGQQFNNCGSTIVQELAFTLAVGHEYVVKLMEQGLTIDQAAPSIRFTMSVSSNYFMEIAKFRAARMLWANIIAQYKPTRGCASKMKIHAVTSKWNMTVYDPYVNMLRGTTEAMSAAIAGVHSIEVRPFDEAYEKPTDFSTRIARNVQLLLKEESHFNQVCDAAGGSYYIENLTASIAEQAWKLFKEVEDRGGYIAAFEAGFIQDQIEASAATKDKNIATRRETPAGDQPLELPRSSRARGHCRNGYSGRQSQMLLLGQTGRRRRAPAASIPRRHGIRTDAPERRPQRKRAQSVHAHLRFVGICPRPRAVLLQLLRLRRHPRTGQHLLQEPRRGC